MLFISILEQFSNDGNESEVIAALWYKLNSSSIVTRLLRFTFVKLELLYFVICIFLGNLIRLDATGFVKQSQFSCASFNSEY